jgi:hypothetical protein
MLLVAAPVLLQVPAAVPRVFASSYCCKARDLQEETRFTYEAWNFAGNVP